jgi:hypothetical protein
MLPNRTTTLRAQLASGRRCRRRRSAWGRCRRRPPAARGDRRSAPPSRRPRPRARRRNLRPRPITRSPCVRIVQPRRPPTWPERSLRASPPSAAARAVAAAEVRAAAARLRVPPNRRSPSALRLSRGAVEAGGARGVPNRVQPPSRREAPAAARALPAIAATIVGPRRARAWPTSSPAAGRLCRAAPARRRRGCALDHDAAPRRQRPRRPARRRNAIATPPRRRPGRPRPGPPSAPAAPEVRRLALPSDAARATEEAINAPTLVLPAARPRRHRSRSPCSARRPPPIPTPRSGPSGRTRPQSSAVSISCGNTLATLPSR